jgi:putative oxidoreductase
MERHRIAAIVGWGLVWLATLMLVFAFGAQGLAKFSSTSGWASAFETWGYPVWFRMLIGVLEIAAALLLLWPKSAPVGACIIIVVMIGGLSTHIIKENGRHVQSEIGPLIFATIVLVSRARQFGYHRRIRAAGASASARASASGAAAPTG